MPYFAQKLIGAFGQFCEALSGIPLYCQTYMRKDAWDREVGTGTLRALDAVRESQR
jgi:hypothetical protein